MTPFFTLLAYLKLNDPLFYFSQVLNDPPFLSFPFTQLPPFFFKVILPNGPPFFTVAFVYLSMIDWNFLKSCIQFHVFLAVLPACPQWPPFYSWLPNDPQFSGFFTPMTLPLLHLARNGLVFTRVVYWMTPYFGEYTFYLIGPYFWLGVGTYLSLQIGSAPPPPPRGFDFPYSFQLESRALR